MGHLNKLARKTAACFSKLSYKAARRRLFAGTDSEKDRRRILMYQFEHIAKQYCLNLDAPRRYNEKLQWLKLYYHRHPDPLVTLCSGKDTVREYIAKCVGSDYLVPVVGVYERPEEIDFESLPEKFVVKINWGSGQNIICKNKGELDWPACKRKLTEWLHPLANHYFSFLEWGYKNIVPRIIIEEYLPDVRGVVDYKFFCFGGMPRLMLVVGERESGAPYFDYYDMDMRKLPVRNAEKSSGHIIASLPEFELMKKLASRLSAPFPHVRVDFYVLPNGKVKCGELTFFHAAGYDEWYPIEWDDRLGSYIELPFDNRI